MAKSEKDNVEQESVIAKTTEQALPEGGWGWLVCIAGFTAQFTILGIQNNTGILYTSLLTEFHGSKGDTAWVFSIGLGLMFLFCPITSSICERAGCRIVAIVGGLLGVLSFILSSFVKDLYVLYLTFGVLWGVGSSMTYLPSIMALPFWFRKRISVANGIVTAGSGFGTLAMGPLMHITVTKLGWQNSVRVLAGVVLVCAISGALYSVPKTKEEKIVKKEEKQKKPLFEFSVLKNKAFLVWCVSLGVFMIGYFVPFVHLPGYAIECGVSNEQSATLVGMMSIGSTFGRLFFGKLCDHPRVNRLYVFQLAFMFIGVAHTLSTLTKSYIGFVSYMVVFGVFDGCFVVLLGVLCADIVGYDKVASGMGIQFFFMAITCTAGPPLAGLVYDLSSSYQIAFYASGACATLGSCLLFLIPVLMPKDQISHDIVQLDDSTESSEQNSEQRLIKSPLPSDDREVSLRSGATRSYESRNSYVEWDNIHLRASCSSFFGASAPFGVLPSVNFSNDTLLVVERVSQV